LPLTASESLIQPFKRSMDEARDTAASFRYFVDMEAEMEIMRGRQRLPATGATVAETRKATEGAQPSSASTSARASGDGENKLKGAKEGRMQKQDHGRNGNESRGKRKVTFDIKPDALIADGPSPEKNGSSQMQGTQPWRFSRDFLTVHLFQT
jgi:hypothetical protein